MALKTCQSSLAGAKQEIREGSTTELTRQAAQTGDERISPQALLPDLVVLETTLNKACKLSVTVKNQGGAIADLEHGQAQIYISAGPGNVLPARQRYLRVLDPNKELKTPGGVVTYVTDLQIAGTQSTLVWLDTSHDITEINEQNNGDDQELSCKTLAGGPVFGVQPQKASPVQGQPGAILPQPAEVKPVNQGKKDGVMYNLTRSITVISPAQGDFLAQGDQVDIIWNVVGDLETDCMVISLQRDTDSTIINGQYHDTRQGTSTHYQQGYTWNIPSTPNLQGPAYWVRVETCDSTVVGDSGSFLFPGMNPEYSVSNIHISPSSPYVGDTINIMADITNMGGLNSNGYQSFTLDYNVYRVGETYGNPQTTDSGLLQAPPLGFGGRYQVTLPYTLTQEGLHRVYFHVLPYPGGEIMDPFLGNNSGWLQFTVGTKLPDLVVCFKHFMNHHPGAQTYPPKVKNIGNAASGPANLKFWIEGRGTENYSIDSLPPDGEQTVQREVHWWLYELGLDTNMGKDFKLTVDSEEEVDEGVVGESNNIMNGHILIKRWQHTLNYPGNSQTLCSDVPGPRY